MALAFDFNTESIIYVRYLNGFWCTARLKRAPCSRTKNYSEAFGRELTKREEKRQRGACYAWGAVLREIWFQENIGEAVSMDAMSMFEELEECKHENMSYSWFECDSS